MAKAPYFKLYIYDFLTGTMSFTAEEIGAYILLLMHQWDKGYIPTDSGELSVIAKVSDKKLKRVLKKFMQVDESSMKNIRLEQERGKFDEFMQKQAGNGSKGGRPKRANNPTKTQPKPMGFNNETQNEPKETHSISNTNVLLSESESQSKDTNVSRAHTPTLQQVQEMFWQMGVQDDAAAQHFFGHYEARGWCTDQGTPFKSIKGLVMSWMNNPIASKQVTAAPSPAVAAYQQSYNPNDPKYRD